MKLKKILAVVLAVTLFVCTLPLSVITANAATVISHDVYYTNDFKYYICGGNYCKCGKDTVGISIRDYLTVSDGVVEIPEEIKSYPVTAVSIFDNPNGEVKTLKISKTVKEVDLCSGFENFEVDKDNSYLCSVDGVLYSKNKANLIQYPTANTRETYEILDGVSSIFGYSFAEAKNLKKINFPSSLRIINWWAFSGCTGLTSVTLPKKITNIYSSVFDDCKNLTDIYFTGTKEAWGKIEISSQNSGLKGAKLHYLGLIFDYTISNGEAIITGCETSAAGNISIPTTIGGYPVTSIKSSAFLGCNNITSINIPESVTSIGDNCFNISGLTKISVDSNNRFFISIDGVLFDKKITKLIRYPKSKTAISYDIPNSVTKIYANAFNSCINLKSVTIPKGVTSIDYGTFQYCSGLESVTISEGVKSIGNYAFYGCTSLKSMIIPNGIINIDFRAFANCTKLIDVMIPKSVLSINDTAFNYSSNVVINTFYNSYAANYAIRNNITVIYYKDGKLVQINAIPNKLNANFFVYATGSSISNVTTTYADGRYTAEKSGYYTVDIGNCTLNSGNMKKLALVPKNSNSYISAVHANGIDILAGELITRDHDKTNVTINVYPANGVNVEKYQLMHKMTVISENTNGSFTFTSDQMQQSDEYYVRIVDTSGKKHKKIKINYENKALVDVELETGNLFEIEVPDDVPFIGGIKFELSLEDLPIYSKLEGNSLYIALGVECDKTKDELNFETYRNFVDETMKDINKGINMYRMSKEYGEGRGWKFWQGNATEGFKGSIKTNFFGYCEIQFDDNGNPHLKGSNAAFSVSGSVGSEWQTFIGAVPVVVKVNGEAEAEVSVTLAFSKDNKLHTSGEFDITLPKITASAGVGVTGVADISLYGSGKNVISVKSVPPQIIGTLSGEIGISMKALVWSSKINLLSGDLEYYNSLRVSSYSLRSAPLSNIKIGNMLVNEDNYVIDRSYLENQSEWLSNPKIQTYGLKNRSSDYDVSTITELQNNIYDGASPQVVTINSGDRIMVWTADISERSDYNHTAVVYSVYSPQNDYWTKPKIIYDDGTADFSPKIATDGADVYVVWSNASEVFNGAPDMSEVASRCEIAYAKFDLENYSFDQAKTLTNDNLYDTNPQVFVNEGKCYISWVKNSANAPLTLEGTNDICSAVIGDKADVSIFASENAPVTENAIGLLNNDVTIAYAIDSDGDFSTSGDAIIRAAALGKEPTVISAAEEQGNIIFANMIGTDKLLWYKCGSVVAISKIDSTEETLIQEMASAKFEVVANQNQMAVVYSSQGAEDEIDGAKLYAQIYNNNSFSSPVCVFEDIGTYVQGANGYIDKNGNLRVVFLKKSVEFYESSLGEQTSLHDAKIVPNYNLKVSDVFYNEDNVAIGENFEIIAKIKNNGLFTMECFNVEILDSDKNVIYSTSLNTILESGKETELKIAMPFPNITSVKKYTLNVYPENMTEANVLDNSMDITIGYSALSLNVEKVRSGASQGALLTVKNSGRKDEEADLYIYENDKGGTLLGVYSLGTIKAGATAMFNYSPQKLRQLCPESDILYFEIITNSEEKYIGDNGAYFTYKIVMLDIGDGTQIEYFYDINDDGDFNILDLVHMNIMLEDTENTEQHSGRDVSGDEILNSNDLIFIMKKLLDLL